MPDVSVLVVWPTLAKTDFGQTDFGQIEFNLLFVVCGVCVVCCVLCVVLRCCVGVVCCVVVVLLCCFVVLLCCCVVVLLLLLCVVCCVFCVVWRGFVFHGFMKWGFMCGCWFQGLVWTALDRPKFRSLFPSPGCLLVEFRWCFGRPGRSNVHVWALWLSCETRAHTTTRELQTCTFERSGASNTTKIPR